MQSLFGINNFNPKLVTSSEQLKAVDDQVFTRFIGHPIEKTWVLLDRSSKRWWTEWPLILQINGCRLEVFVEDMDKIGVSSDSIDPEEPLFENSDGAGNNLEWKENALPELINVLGHKIQRIFSVEYHHTCKF